MKKQWWVLLLTGLLVLSALFIGCDELDDDDDDSSPSEIEGLVGTWVMATGTVNEDDAVYSSVTEFEENGNGVSYVMTYGTNDMYEVWNFTWEDVEGELEIDPDGSDAAFTVDFNFNGDDIVEFSYLYNGHREETYYRVTTNRDNALYGLWNLTSMTIGGTPVEGATGTVNFGNDGDLYVNLDIEGEAITDTMSWSTLNNHIITLSDDDDDEIIGEVIAYVLNGTTLTVTVASEEGIQVNVFEKHVPGDLDPELVGRWMTYSMTSGGEVVDMREAIFFYDNGTGVSYHQEMDSEEYDVEAVNFLWEVVDGDLIVDTEQDDPMTIEYSIDGAALTIDFMMEGNAIVEVLVKWSDEIDNALVGEWVLESETVNGEPVEDAYSYVVLNDDGTGSYSSFGDSDDFTWCVNGEYLTIGNDDDYVGFSGMYTVSAEQFVFTEIYAQGTTVSTFIPYTPSEDLDPDLFGTWIGSTRYINGEIVDGYSIISLSQDGTGIFAFELEIEGNWQEYYQLVTWSTNGEGTLYLYEGETLIHTVTYAVNGDVANTELTNDNNEFVEQTYYKKTENNPADMVGTWVLESQTLEGSSNIMMSMAATAIMEADGSLTIYYSEDGQMGDEEEMIEAHGDWCVNGEYFLMHFESEVDDYMVAEAIQFSMPQSNVMEMVDPRDEGVYNFNYRKFEGTIDSDMVGTWVMYLTTTQVMEMEWLDSDNLQTIVANSDGTGTVYSAFDEGDDYLDEYEVEEFDFMWVVSDGRLIVVDEDGSGNVMPYTINGDFLQMTMQMYMEMEEDQYTTFTMLMDWVRHTGDLDSEVFGDWVLTDMLEDGTSVGVEEPVSITLNNDGTGEYTEDTITDNFSWSSSNGYLLVNVGGEDFPPELLEGIEYDVEAGELRITEYEVDYSEGMPQTITYVEIFTRPTR
jgi:hypothetical protein